MLKNAELLQIEDPKDLEIHFLFLGHFLSNRFPTSIDKEADPRVQTRLKPATMVGVAEAERGEEASLVEEEEE